MSIHHVTAIAREPQRNLDFYAGTLGMRLVKLTGGYAKRAWKRLKRKATSAQAPQDL